MPAHPHTGPGAEGGGGWPMHATAQPWHAEGRPLPDVAVRSVISRKPTAPQISDALQHIGPLRATLNR